MRGRARYRDPDTGKVDETADLLTGEEQEGGEPEEAAPLPMRFACRRGAPRGMTLVPTRKGIDPKSGEPYEILGVVFKSEKYERDPGIRIVDVTKMPETRRPNFPVPPERIAKLIMETPYFKGDQEGNGRTIIAWDEYEDEQELAAEKSAAMLQLDAEYRRKLAAKRGKRGAAQ